MRSVRCCIASTVAEGYERGSPPRPCDRLAHPGHPVTPARATAAVPLMHCLRHCRMCLDQRPRGRLGRRCGPGCSFPFVIVAAFSGCASMSSQAGNISDGSSAAGAVKGLISVRSPHSASDTMNHLEQAAKQRDLKIFARIDHAAGAASIGSSLRPTQVLIFGNPRSGTPMMQCAQTTGIDPPLKHWSGKTRHCRSGSATTILCTWPDATASRSAPPPTSFATRLLTGRGALTVANVLRKRTVPQGGSPGIDEQRSQSIRERSLTRGSRSSGATWRAARCCSTG